MKLFTVIFVLLVMPLVMLAQDAQNEKCEIKNKLINDDRSGKPMLIGYCDRSALEDSTFSWWFNSEYDNYEVNKEALEPIQKNLNDYRFTVVMGTWCSDSRREIPRFYRIVDDMGINEDNIKLIMVDHGLKTQKGEIDSLDIKAVPTIIMYKDGKELGRIVESPETTLEGDLTAIAEGKKKS